MVTVSLNAQSGTFFPSNVFFLNLPTNASPVAFIAVDEAGKVYETAAPAGGSGSGSLVTNPLASAAVNTLFSAPTRLVFDGDSLTSSNFSHPFYTSNRLGVAGASIVVTNTAISGQTIPQMIARYTNFVQPNKPVTGTNAILFAWGGINDVYFATNGANTTIANLSNYWAIAKADGFTLVAFTISSRSDFPGLTNSSTVAFLNQWIRSQATWDYLVDVDQIFPTWLPTTHLLESTAYIHFTTNSQRMISDMALATLFSPEHLNVPPNNMLTQFIGTNYFDQGSELGPSIAFNQERNMGFSRAATSLMGLTIGGVGEFIWGSTISRQSSDITLQWASGAGYSTSGDVGLSRLAANSLALGNGGNGNASGTLALGNVGIGTTTPTNRLHVVGGATVETNLYVGGRVGIGTNAPAAKLAVIADNSALYVLQVGTTNSPSLFTVDTNGTVSMANLNVANLVVTNSSRMFAQTNTVIVTNTATSSALLSGVGTTNISASRLAIGSTIRINVWGIYFTPGSPAGTTLTLRVLLNGSVVAQSLVAAPPAAAAGQSWRLNYDGTVRLASASGLIMSGGTMTYAKVAAGTSDTQGMPNTTTATVDTTAAITVSVDATFNNTTDADAIHCQGGTIEIIP